MKSTLYKIFLAGCIICFFYSGWYMSTNSAADELVSSYKEVRSNIESGTGNETAQQMEDVTLISQNYEISVNENIEVMESIDNYVGWIRINNTRIDYPIVRADDNEYYLNRGYDHKFTPKGSIFMDKRNLGNGLDQHTILYGHNMKDGSMFADLHKYGDAAFIESNGIIEIEDIYKNRKYRVVSAYFVDADIFELPYELNDEIIRTFIERSDVRIENMDEYRGNVLTLSTCSYNVENGRMIVHAIEVED